MDIKSFEAIIKEQEDQLFGIELFMYGVRRTYKENKDVINYTEKHYRDIQKRGKHYIAKAKKLLEYVKTNPRKIILLEQFKFPPIRGTYILDGMTKRAQFLVKAYEELFPNRPKERTLTEGEYELLRQRIISDFDE